MDKNKHNNFEIPSYTNNRELLNRIMENNKRTAKTGKGRILFNSVFIDLNSVVELPNKQKVWNGCNFRCPGCFKLTDRQENLDRLTFPEMQNIVDFAKERGAVSITIAGAGEPLLDQDFWKAMEYVNKKGLTLNVFTNGTMIDEERANKLFKSKANIIVKRNTLDEIKQDYLVGNIKGASKKIEEGLNKLLKAGFKAPRLAIDSYISKQNQGDLPDLLRYCRKNQIMPYFEAFITVGQEEVRYSDRILSQKEFNALFKKLQKIDEKEFGIKIKVFSGARVYGQLPCIKNYTMFSARTNGNIAPCVSSNYTIGNMRKQTLEEIFNPRENKRLKEAYLTPCNCSMKTT